jgi:shikimate dehydrogenase
MTTTARTLRLGLIGGNITATRSPTLHMLCGLSTGVNVTYDLLIPAEQRLSFADLLAHCEALGFCGVNVTYPHKEDAAALVETEDPVVRAMGSANTVLFTQHGPRAFNTDHSGFVAAYRARFCARNPGRVLMIGCGGVGRAVGFALADLGASEIVLFDTDAAKIASLAAALAAHAPVPVRTAAPSLLHALEAIDGVVNCTPLGMAGRPGSPLPAGATGTPAWAFDAVYTPEDTQFRAQVSALGAAFLSGYELYFQQGIRAFEIFSGRPVTAHTWLREVLSHHP